MTAERLEAGQGKAVVFDFYGTLSDPHVELDRAAAYAATGRALGVDGDDFWREMWRSFSERVVGGLGSTRETLDVIARRCGSRPSDRQLDQALVLHLETAETLRSPRPGGLEVLDRIRFAGLQIGLLSDCSSELAEAWETTPYAPRIDAAVFSWRLGVRKPDPRAFLEVTSALDVAPSDCWYVGDGGSRELWGANRLGMTTVLVRNAAYGVEHLRVDADTQEPAYAVDDLMEVPDLVLASRR